MYIYHAAGGALVVLCGTLCRLMNYECGWFTFLYFKVFNFVLANECRLRVLHMNLSIKMVIGLKSDQG